MKITLIRHTSVAVPAGICYGQTDVDVSERFISEAEVALRKLDNADFDAVYTSPLQRCRKLADFCGHSSALPDDRLMEMNFGAWEMQAWNEITDAQLNVWFADWVHEKPSQGESFCEMLVRVESFLNELKALQADRVAIFTHAGVIRAFGILLNRFPVEKAFEFTVNYGDVVVMEC